MSGLSNILNGTYASPSLQTIGLPSSSCTNRERPHVVQGLVDMNIRGVLKVSCVLQRRRENKTSIARSEISDTSSTKAMVYSLEPKHSKFGSDGKSTISFNRITESFQNVTVPSRLLIL